MWCMGVTMDSLHSLTECCDVTPSATFRNVFIGSTRYLSIKLEIVFLEIVLLLPMPF